MIIKNHLDMPNSRGVTLLELLIVVVIIGIIAAVAIPSYQNQAVAANRTDGINTLLEIQGQMERHYFDNNSYPNGLAALAVQTSDSVTSDNGDYIVTMNITAACPITSCYELVATPQGGQAADGNLQLFSNGAKLPADKW